MRSITEHQVNACNRAIVLEAGEADPTTGAPYEYEVRHELDGSAGIWRGLLLSFQSGDPRVVGINGVTQEVLLAVVIDRLEGFQTGPFACEENELTLGHLRRARQSMLQRTQAREVRGVEGTRAP